MKKTGIIVAVVLAVIAAFVYWKMNGFSKAIDEAVDKTEEN